MRYVTLALKLDTTSPRIHMVTCPPTKQVCGPMWHLPSMLIIRIYRCLCFIFIYTKELNRPNKRGGW